MAALEVDEPLQKARRRGYVRTVQGQSPWNGRRPSNHTRLDGGGRSGMRPLGQLCSPPALLSGSDAARHLGISRTTWCRLLPRLRAAGLHRVIVPGRVGRGIARYTRESLDALIARAATTEGALC